MGREDPARERSRGAPAQGGDPAAPGGAWRAGGGLRHLRRHVGRLPRLRAHGGRGRLPRGGRPRYSRVRAGRGDERRGEQVPARAGRAGDRRGGGRAKPRPRRRERPGLRREVHAGGRGPEGARRVARHPLRRGAPRAARGENLRDREGDRGGDHTEEFEVTMSVLQQVDPEVAEAIRQETEREAMTLELIASEKFVSEAVLEAQGSVLTNKYAEGLPGKRYYGGCVYVDVVEDLAIARAKALFGADAANVQPHSGAQANMAVYFAVLKPGDTYLGMNLSHGGHLTHGSPVNFSGKLYRVVPYGVRKDTEMIDYDQVMDLAREHRPKLIVVGASAHPRIIDFKA